MSPLQNRSIRGEDFTWFVTIPSLKPTGERKVSDWVLFTGYSQVSVKRGRSWKLYTILENDVMYIEFPIFGLGETVTIYTMSLFWKSYISILGYLSPKSTFGYIRKAFFENHIYASFVFKLGKGNFIYTISIKAIAYILFTEKCHFGAQKHIYNFKNQWIVYSRIKLEAFSV